MKAPRLGVFDVLNLQLQLFDAHISLVEELPQSSDFLLLLVERHEQLQVKHTLKSEKSKHSNNKKSNFWYLVLCARGRAERVVVSIDDGCLTLVVRCIAAVALSVFSSQLVLKVCQLTQA